MLKQCWETVRQWCQRVPVFGAVFGFSAADHRETIAKFGFLWVISTSPIFASVLMSEIPAGPGSPIEKLWDKFAQSFSLREQFVYSASFLAPVLYIAIDTIKKSRDENGKLLFDQISRNVPSGYRSIFSVSFVLLIVAAFAHSRAFGGEGTERIFFFYFTSNYSLFIYGFALYLWYLSLLDEKTPKKPDFRDDLRSSGMAATDGLRARLAARRAGNEH